MARFSPWGRPENAVPRHGATESPSEGPPMGGHSWHPPVHTRHVGAMMVSCSQGRVDRPETRKRQEHENQGGRHFVHRGHGNSLLRGSGCGRIRGRASEPFRKLALSAVAYGG